MQSLFHLFAASSNNIVETTLFGNLQDDGSGCGVYMILNLILEILTYGVAILAVIGITIVGINYLTAKGNEQQTQKAKRRIYEIILGLATYAIMYAGLNFLLPGGHFNPSSSCTTVSDQELAKIKAEEAKAQAAEQAKQEADEKATKAKANEAKATTAGGGSSGGSNSSLPKDYKRCMKKAAKTVRDQICNLSSPNDRLSETLKILAWPAGTSSKIYKNRPTASYKKAAAETGVPDRVANPNAKTEKDRAHYAGKSCAMYICVSVAASGIDPYFPGGTKNKSHAGCNTSAIYNYLIKTGRWKEISKLSPSSPRPGDIRVTNGWGHVAAYVKDKKKIVIAQGNLNIYYGLVLTNAKWQSHASTIFRYVGN